MHRKLFWLTTVLLLIRSNTEAQVPQIINYQGRVTVNRSNFDGPGFFKFSLLNSNGTATFWSNDGSAVGGGEPHTAVSAFVDKGIFSVALGDATLTNMTPIPPTAFTNSDVRLRVWFTDGKTGFQQLEPDQRITSVAYAMVAAIATTATNFIGNLSGDVAGPQGATVVVSVGGQSAASVAAAATAANAATSANAPGTIAKRDLFGSFAAGSITASSFAGDGSALRNLNGANLIGGSVLAAQIAAGAVGNAQLAVNAVQAQNIAPGAIGSAQISDNAVTSAHLAPGSAAANLLASGQTALPRSAIILSKDAADTNLFSAGFVKVGTSLDMGGEAWVSGPVGPNGRQEHTAIWTGTEMIVWGGYVIDYLNTGTRYNPTAATWTAITTNGAPSKRWRHTAIWTGSEMIIWGGYGGTYLNDGARYNPVTGSWTAISTNGAPIGREEHTAIWTGTEMIVWGGGPNMFLNDGGAYNPVANSWRPLNTTGAPSARAYHSAVWTGREMIIWGGSRTSAPFNDGGRYNPGDNQWDAIPSIGAPPARAYHIAVWAGKDMVIWGGNAASSLLTDGARYDPLTGSWTALPVIGAPSPRAGSSGVWTGAELIIWGGVGLSSPPYFNDGARYNLAANTWINLTMNGVPVGRSFHTAVWAQNQMIIWSGETQSSGYPGQPFSYFLPQGTAYFYVRP